MVSLGIRGYNQLCCIEARNQVQAAVDLADQEVPPLPCHAAVCAQLCSSAVSSNQAQDVQDKPPERHSCKLHGLCSC